MEIKNYIGKVISIKKSKIETDVEVLASNKEEAIKKIEEDIRKNDRVIFRNYKDNYNCDARSEIVISYDTNISVSEVE